MKVGRKPGVTRRPIEYGLTILLALLVGFLVWSNSVIENDTKASDKSKALYMIEGTVDEIGQLTEADVLEEEAIDQSYEAKEENSVLELTDSTSAVSNFSEGLIIAELTCENVDEVSGFYLSNLDRGTDYYKNSVAELHERIKARRTSQDQNLVAARANHDIDRTKSYQMLTEKQFTDQDKSSAIDYTVAIDSIVTERREALDSVRRGYRNNMDIFIGDRQSGIYSTIDYFKSSVDNSFNGFKDGCVASQDISQSRDELENDLRLAGEYFKQSLPDNNEFASTVKQEARFKRDSIKQINANFEKKYFRIRADYLYLDDYIQSGQVPDISRE